MTTTSWAHRVWMCLRRGATGLRWWWRGVVGADAYEHYVAHLRACHPDTAVPSERQFWKNRYDEEERNPTARCC
ncbi:MAG: YbdD/YjiX family protein [Dermatophilaceae bacterium]